MDWIGVTFEGTSSADYTLLLEDSEELVRLSWGHDVDRDGGPMAVNMQHKPQKQ